MAKASESKPVVKNIALHNITVDHDIQSRVAMSIPDMHEFSESMLRGDVFPPATVFYDGKTYLLADGFHRHGAALKAGLTHIKCEVIRGDRADALVYSAGANKKFSVPRKPEDIRKSIRILLSDPRWFEFTDIVISKHVGCAHGTVRDERDKFCRSKDIDLPVYRVNKDGVRIKTKVKASAPKLRTEKVFGQDWKYTVVDGEKITLGPNEKSAENEFYRVRREYREDVEKKAKARGYVPRNIYEAMRHFRETYDIKLQVEDAVRGYAGINGLRAKGVIIGLTNFKKPGLLHEVGNVLALRAKVDPGSRVVILCRPEKGPQSLIKLFQSIGIEFMTPEAFARDVVLGEKVSSTKKVGMSPTRK